MNSFVKTKMDKSQKEEEDRRESSFASKTSADSKKKKIKVPWWYHHKKRSSIGFSLCYLCIHARVIIIDYYSIRDRVCYIVYKPASSYFFLFARPVSKYVFKTSLTFFAIVFGSHMAPTPESPHASVFSIGFKKYTPYPNGCFP